MPKKKGNLQQFTNQVSNLQPASSTDFGPFLPGNRVGVIPGGLLDETFLYEGDVELGRVPAPPLQAGGIAPRLVPDVDDPDPVRAAERRKLLGGLPMLKARRSTMNAARASSLLSSPGRNLLNETIQRGLISQPLLAGR